MTLSAACRYVLSALLSMASPADSAPPDAAGQRAEAPRGNRLEMLAAQLEERGKLIESAKIWKQLEREERALELCDRALAAYAESVRALELRAALFLDRGRLEDAKRDLTRALKIEPLRMSARLLRASALSRSGATQEAAAEFRGVLEKHPREAAAHYGLAICLEADGDTVGARGHLERAIEIDPRHAPAHYRLGNIELRGGRRKEGLVHLRRFRQLKAERHYARGEREREAKRDARAIRAYERALDAYPAFVDAHGRLGKLYLDAGETEKALHHAREAARLEVSATRWANLAWVCHQIDRADEAKRSIRRALQLDAESAAIRALAVDILQVPRKIDVPRQVESEP